MKLWTPAWAEFAPFLAYDPEIWAVVYSMPAIESINGRIRRAVCVRGHFPTDQAALKCVYLAVRSHDPTGNGRRRWKTRWEPAIDVFALTFEGSINPSHGYPHETQLHRPPDSPRCAHLRRGRRVDERLRHSVHPICIEPARMCGAADT